MTFSQVNNFFLENSYGQTSLSGIVAGWFTITSASTSCNYNTWASMADQAAINAGVDLSAYPRRVYGFPQTSACSWWGLGTVGGGSVLTPRAPGSTATFRCKSSLTKWVTASACITRIPSRAIPLPASRPEYGDDHDVMG